jgi:hypothetical protein
VKSEQSLTGAIVQVTGGRRTRVCFSKGHGEWTDRAGDDRSIKPLQEMLRHDNIEWEAVDTLGKKRIPETCDALFVVGPAMSFPEDEARLVVEYVHQGGNALLALDPIIERDEIKTTGFETVLRELGVIVDPSLVIELDPNRLLTPNAVEFLVTEFGDHETTRPLANNARAFFSLARGVRPEEGSGVEILVRSSPDSFAETDISQVQGEEGEPAPDGRDLKGPVAVAVAAVVHGGPANDGGEAGTGGRLIVVGDADWLQETVIGSPELANHYLASAWTGWLTEREALIAIPPKEASGASVSFTQDDLSGLRFRVVVLMPAAILIIGFAVWFNRRS